MPPGHLVLPTETSRQPFVFWVKAYHTVNGTPEYMIGTDFYYDEAERDARVLELAKTVGVVVCAGKTEVK